ncbi:NUDIX domain-containing protein [Roseibium denhamense]|uniref:ADP-ribose pyrophosphatase YjhB, NUDIX family n=1 Tax=Roseibium denhamense TaxID=76305 RepID=A0ABY1NH18_9HYPH|nr:NUDIX domain-containing protein [Roseibium denhamense]MTI06484.1 NUDIX domain-containing protein [Roseibium denhamense]SMP09469.1 ADP-ribose pyrophosphatase YjhB, NUDIX family [Roseibium denhamense]
MAQRRQRPSEFRPLIRATPRAFILKDNYLLVQEKRHPQKGHFFTLPGGKQEPGERLDETLKRECVEEIGAEVAVGDLIHVAEVFRQKSATPEKQHQLDFVFLCTVDPSYRPVVGPDPDPHQVGTCWLPVDRFEQLRPAYVTKLFSLGDTREHKVYLGHYND